ncbi:hypothetical protein BGY98DRAFT_601734 [Russula aff. rugulosa BPL654]|nr:hypothetical protein BGY98DRAFT_601734 [Russula aff. rugulosa BPL654]
MPSRSGSDHRSEILEVEDVEQRQRRLHILERLNGEGSSTEQSPNLSFDFGVRRTFSIEPPAELLARVREFLPQIEQSNVELSQRDPRSIDIENIEETDEHVVEMNLGLGVFEQRPARRLYSISSSSSSSGSLGSDSSSTESESESSGSESSSDPEDDSDANRDGSLGSPRTRPIRPLPKRQSPMIQVLSSTMDEEVSSESAGDFPAAP